MNLLQALCKRRTISHMARKSPKSLKLHPGRRLTKKNPHFYELIGQRGGSATKKNHEDGYFSRLAQLSHVARKRAKEASASSEPNTAE